MKEQNKERNRTVEREMRKNDDKSFIRLPRQDLPGMMKSLKSSYKT
jgi:hypothetical protein